MNRIIVMDIGNIQFRAIFNYLGQYKKSLKKIMKKTGKSIYEAKEELWQKIRNREIFLGNPDYTFCNMISGYCNILKIDLEDTIIMAQDYGSWRKDISKEYKQQRRSYLVNTIMESLYVEQEEAENWIQNQYNIFEHLYNKLNIALPFIWIKKWKIEADDIGSVCCRYYKDRKIILISSDKDWEMLLYFPNVEIFSIISKEFKKVLNPMGVLLEKTTKQEISDNLKNIPSSEVEFEKRKLLVDLVNPLPNFVENPIKEELGKILPKNVYFEKIPFRSIRNKFKKIYNL